MKTIFVDSSVLFSAVISETGGSRKNIIMGELGEIRLAAGPTVFRETEAVIRRKKPKYISTLARMLQASNIILTSAPSHENIQAAKRLVDYLPDTHVFAEAIQSKADWFLTHDKKHFLTKKENISFNIQIGTPGDFLQSLSNSMIN